MVTKEKIKLDKDGYQLLPKVFTQSGHTFTFVELLDKDWQIYQKVKNDTKSVHFELVKIKKQEEFICHGTKIPKKQNYPSTGNFGREGFDCISLNHCYHIYNTWVLPRQKANEQENETIDIILPKLKTFTLKDLENLNKSLTYAKLSVKIKEMVAQKELKIVGEKANKKGRASKIFCVI